MEMSQAQTPSLDERFFAFFHTIHLKDDERKAA